MNYTAAQRQCGASTSFRSQDQWNRRVHSAPRSRRDTLRVQANFGDAIRDLFDFEKWAPRSSRAWRNLGQTPSPPVNNNSQDTEITDNDVEVLNQRLATARQSIQSMDILPEDDDIATYLSNSDVDEGSFLRSTDEEITSALNTRISSMDTVDSEEDSEPFSGAVLIDLVYQKYGKKHDLSFVRRDIPGKTLITLNIYYAYLGQRSFPMSEEEYIEKMDGIALLLGSFNQISTVKAFLESPITPRRGLPSRPIVGNAVAIPLELSREQITEWFGR